MTTPVLVGRAPWSTVSAPAVAWRWSLPARRDPRIPFAAILTVYAILGCTVLTFSRGPVDIALTVLAGCALDMALHALIRERELLLPLSAYISSLSLALLLNSAHGSWLFLWPVFLTIGSKYALTYQGRHVFNPSMFGVTASLLFSGELISSAPAYQWGGTVAMSAFIVTAALALFVFRIGRTHLIGTFLVLYVIQIGIRAYYMRWYLPWEALLWGTLSSAPFYLFVFFMITDPKTSPSSPRGQVLLAAALVTVDLVFHMISSLYTFFYAAFVVALVRFLYLHVGQLVRVGPTQWLRQGLLHPTVLRAVSLIMLIGLGMVATYRHLIGPTSQVPERTFQLQLVPPGRSGVDAQLGSVLQEVDPRVRHIAKWLLSAGSSVAVGDFENTGHLGLFVINPLMRPEDRYVLYRNLGDYHFERVDVPALREIADNPARYGIAATALFVDIDNRGALDLFLGFGYGRNVLLRNMLPETGVAQFVDVSEVSGVDEHSVAIAANFFDYDHDGRLDLIVGNAFATHLTQYSPPRPFNIFRLPAPEYPGDRRMLGFMHASWDNATNGGGLALYRNRGAFHFERQDMLKMGMPETHWTLAIGTGDLNNDGWTDLYVANDFGPDDVYLNRAGQQFERVQGRMVGTIGRDTYKGMNASLGDIDRTGWLDVYVSNVHVPLQAEGSMLWITTPNPRHPFVPNFNDQATARGALNENRFGWGAALGDLNNDGWLDIVQANGMVDDTPDKRFSKCPSYWYVNEKLMRSSPDIHRYADMWGDLRGYCIFGKEVNRVYLNRGVQKRPQFVDVAPQFGWTAETNSRGVVLADLENTGALDVIITHQFGPISIYRNTVNDGPPSTRPHWIGFQLQGNGLTCNRDAAGSRVYIQYEDPERPGQEVRQLREITIANGLSAQTDRRAHFGLGAYGGSVTPWISWCGGPLHQLTPRMPDRYHTIAQSEVE